MCTMHYEQRVRTASQAPPMAFPPWSSGGGALVTSNKQGHALVPFAAQLEHLPRHDTRSSHGLQRDKTTVHRERTVVTPCEAREEDAMGVSRHTVKTHSARRVRPGRRMRRVCTGPPVSKQ